MPKGETVCARSFALSFGGPVLLVVVTLLLILGGSGVSTAQPLEGPPTHSSVQEALGPAISVIAWPIYLLYLVFWYIMKYNSAAILISAMRSRRRSASVSISRRLVSKPEMVCSKVSVRAVGKGSGMVANVAARA